jgi:hypothetical protein
MKAKNKMHIGQHRIDHDLVISKVLDAILEITEIDPSAIFPDDKLTSSLGLNEARLHQLVQRVSETLSLDSAKKISIVGDIPLREFVSMIKRAA